MAKKLTQEEFISRAKKVHGDKYSYDKVVYVNCKTRLIIACPIHGDFTQTPSKHMVGGGCTLCSIDRHTLTNEDFLRLANKHHGDKYLYDYYDSPTCKNNIRIYCKACKKYFTQRTTSHIHDGKGCFVCGKKEAKKNITLTKLEFVERVINKYGNRYDCSKVIYKASKEKVELICKKHGSFFKTPNSFLDGQGCPSCAVIANTFESEISDYVWSLGVYNEINKRKLLNNTKLEIDVWIPSHNLGLEYNGIYWHSSKSSRDTFHILNKSKEAWSKGIDLIHIRSDLWRDKKDIIKSIIRNRLGLNQYKVWARKCKIKKIDIPTYKSFLEENHLQGYRSSKIKLGLYYNNLLVACVGINPKDGELVRYAVKQNWSVGAGLSKLIKNQPVKYSFCDLSVFNGKGYVRSGFEEITRTRPNYRYVTVNNTVSRQSRQKHKLSRVFNNNFDTSLTEEEICAIMDEWRIYDCGNIKFRKR